MSYQEMRNSVRNSQSPLVQTRRSSESAPRKSSALKKTVQEIEPQQQTRQLNQSQQTRQSQQSKQLRNSKIEREEREEMEEREERGRSISSQKQQQRRVPSIFARSEQEEQEEQEEKKQQRPSLIQQQSLGKRSSERSSQKLSLSELIRNRESSMMKNHEPHAPHKHSMRLPEKEEHNATFRLYLHNGKWIAVFVIDGKEHWYENGKHIPKPGKVMNNEINPRDLVAENPY